MFNCKMIGRNTSLIAVASVMTFLVGCGGSPSQGPFMVDTVPRSSVSSSSSSSSSVESSSSSVSAVACEGFGAAATAGGFSISGGQLMDGNGNAFKMRGVNYPYVWFSQRDTEQEFKDIRSVCANTVRVVLATGDQWPRVDGPTITNIISWAKAAGLVTMLEVHDSTGWDEGASAADPEVAVTYWLSDDVRAAIDGEEGYVLINIANEAFGNSKTDEWDVFHKSAITRMRTAGLKHTLVVDAPNWGQDWTNTMRSGVKAQEIFDADVDSNTLFSVHMYDVYGSAGLIDDYFQAFSDKGLPLIVGEFAADHGEGNNVDEDAILSNAETYGSGYLGWSWSGNGGGLGSLDIVENFNVDNLSPWGERLVNGVNGLKATSEICSCMNSSAQ